jgi:hypothetical protein
VDREESWITRTTPLRHFSLPETQREEDEERSRMDFLSPPQSQRKAYIRIKRKENSV